MKVFAAWKEKTSMQEKKNNKFIESNRISSYLVHTIQVSLHLQVINMFCLQLQVSRTLSSYEMTVTHTTSPGKSGTL